MPGQRWGARLVKLSRCEKYFKSVILSYIYLSVTLLPMYSIFASYVQCTEICFCVFSPDVIQMVSIRRVGCTARDT
jgi:hypothetical protein